MKLAYVRPAMTSVRESDLEAVLGPVLLSSGGVDLSTVQPQSTDTAIHAPAPGAGGGHHPASGSTGLSSTERRR
jgi:hypothetical protein